MKVVLQRGNVRIIEDFTRVLGLRVWKGASARGGFCLGTSWGVDRG